MSKKSSKQSEEGATDRAPRDVEPAEGVHDEASGIAAAAGADSGGNGTEATGEQDASAREAQAKKPAPAAVTPVSESGAGTPVGAGPVGEASEPAVHDAEPAKAATAAPPRPAKKGKKKRDFSYTQNREVSWLHFDNRILDEALDETVPLYERLKFCEIFGSNLDEWFMVRVGGLSDLARLKHQPKDNKSNQTPSEQLNTVFDMLPPLLARQEEAWAKIMAGLSKKGLCYVEHNDLTDADLATMARFFEQYVQPIISPMIIDPRHPFPNLRNFRQFVACSLNGPDEKGVLGLVEVPPTLPRVVALPSTDKQFRFTLVEDIISARLDGCFGEYAPTSHAVIRVTRNADVDPDGEGVEEEEDYRLHMKKVLKKRQRLQPIRLEIRGALEKKLESFITSELGLTKKRVFHSNIPLDLGFIYGLEDKIPARYHAELTYQPAEPQISPMVDLARPMRPQVEDHDVLLFYPYESMTPLLQLLREASADDDCISIKITLYRVAKHSHLCESLIAAAENGKEVTVLMELRARFDEANNIAWAERLEDAGCTVIYGQEGYKVHSKCCQITYHDKGNISRITCLGTGNFNEKTAKLYSDFMLLTAHKGIAEDANVFFRNLSLGNLHGSYKYLGVAPVGLKPLIMRGMDREIGRARDGEPAQVFMKMNSLTDRDVIDKIAEACQAGVKVFMIVRGICCIKAGVPGKTEGLVIREIAGRFLEHARVYAFGVDADTIYLSSADMMTRNTEHRVEIAYPIFDPTCRSLVIQYMNIQLADNVKARQLTPEGTWEHVPVQEGAPRLVAQDLLIEFAYWRSHGKSAATEPITPTTRILPTVSVEEARSLLALPGIGTYGVEPEPERQPSEAVTQPAPPEAPAVATESLAGSGNATSTEVASTSDRPQGGADVPAAAGVGNAPAGPATTAAAASAAAAANTGADPHATGNAATAAPAARTTSAAGDVPVSGRQPAPSPEPAGSRTAQAFRLIGEGFRMLFGGK